MGIRRDGEVKVTEGITTSMLTSYVRKVPFKFEIQEDVDAYLPDTTYGLVYPEELGCIVVDGYVENSGKLEYCLGKTGVFATNETMIGKIMIEDNVALSKLASWYIKELNYGNNQFTVSLPFMGTTATWTVKFVEPFVQSLIDGQLGTVAIKLELINYLPSEPI